ncbi:1,4-alpha-glucan branching protein GlgB [Papillibacter cinnamivorans]|uniref:1,4-alpha-glucan branching enzyme GlgB n=1 Tax=Papillibacter cinnamivorans DSM 12816 TaxID=1122930 RepID=A0A1W2A556_9FIRM|nr:1,4-alpha-glucan branching protein GlgB [Papillibacter cinnamivorans]SMC55807.1 1,4-alpha-glucan branching enzyme [Papillibacter cinnamivorans DSM 12816]
MAEQNGANPRETGEYHRYLFHQGTDSGAYGFFGAHAEERNGARGVCFRVWAPHAAAVSVIGDFNAWNENSNPMEQESPGIWALFVPGPGQFDSYKYSVLTKSGTRLDKSDPYAFHAETRPRSASKVYSLEGFEWHDEAWLSYRKANPVYHAPLNAYEVHLGSWQRSETGEFLSYRETVSRLIPYVKEMGFTHVELMPVTEHPLDASWGYQCTGYFAATSRFGTPHDFMYFVDECHRAGVGVILDWVPAHFPKDAHGLMEFDGGCCYEAKDPRQREHPDWGTRIFDYGRNEVRSFLLSSALFWLEQYHIDGLRVDAVASMLYLDYGRKPGEWRPNRYGGKENLEAISFLRALNEAVFTRFPDVLMIAEESTAWPMVTKPGYVGGLGFNLKWNMGWMNDMFHYMKLDPIYRQYNHKDITFSILYAFSENFLLPVSHDEVVHMKGSLLGKMPGDEQSQFAGVRAFYAYMLAHPGKKMLFMGCEFGQRAEWAFDRALDWHLLEEERNQQLKEYFKEINEFYLGSRELWELDFQEDGFQWICPDDSQGNTVSFLRKNAAGEFLVCVCNFSGTRREGYRTGVPEAPGYRLELSTDDVRFGGTGQAETREVPTELFPWHGHPCSIVLDLPPLSALFFRKTEGAKPEAAEGAALSMCEGSGLFTAAEPRT